MDVKQIATMINEVTQEITADIPLLTEDLSNVVAVGDALVNVEGLDAYVRALPNRIGRTVFVDRVYAGGAPNILRNSFEYGSILMKVRGRIPEAEENEAWDLVDGQTYEMNIFTKPDVSAEFINKAVTFEIPISITEKQVKQSFASPAELSAFHSMLYNEIDKSMTLKLDALIMRAINNMIAETIYDGVGNTYTNTSVRAVNLLKLYNTQYGTSLTQANAIYDKDFIRYAIFTMAKYRDYMKRATKAFNMEGFDRFTPEEYSKTVLLTDFAKAAGVFLYDANGQFRTDSLSLGEFETVPFWQGSGTSFAFSDLSKIDVTTASGYTVQTSGVLGVIFDRDAIVVCNEDRYVTTAPFNGRGEFWNSWHKWKCTYGNFFDENCVVFYIA
jgi:hypothetical protein